MRSLFCWLGCKESGAAPLTVRERVWNVPFNPAPALILVGRFLFASLKRKPRLAAPRRQTPGKGTPSTTWPQGLPVFLAPSRSGRLPRRAAPTGARGGVRGRLSDRSHCLRYSIAGRLQGRRSRLQKAEGSEASDSTLQAQGQGGGEEGQALPEKGEERTAAGPPLQAPVLACLLCIPSG